MASSTAKKKKTKWSGPERTMKDLIGLAPKELNRLYRDAVGPASVSVLNGTPNGAVLCVTGPGSRFPLNRIIRSAVDAKRFPWLGKTFHSDDGTSGSGANRIKLRKTVESFPFATRIEPSQIDHSPCVVLDYDVPTNPRLIRKIRDELRQVGPQLYMGPGMVRIGDNHLITLYFAVEF